jgi:predicted Co/Zn/Cd cation transporter (cation efflux family)
MFELDHWQDWKTDFESAIAKFIKVVEGKDDLDRVGFNLVIDYIRKPSKDTCRRTLERWKDLKDELKSMCGKKGIEVVQLYCTLRSGHNVIWEDEAM